MTDHLLDQPHHDGSERHVSDPEPDLGDVVTLRVRVPDVAHVDDVRLRSTHDGEERLTTATVDRRGDGETWWRADMPMTNPEMRYRWLLGRDDDYTWLHAGGLSDHDVPDDTDFHVDVHGTAPAWATEGVMYQVLPDRFARGLDDPPWPTWAEPASWDDPPRTSGDRAMRQTYGGDLVGLRRRLDHLRHLGVTSVWLNPIWPARSYHRYDASTFDRVDPLLGGDAALRDLLGAAHDAGIRVIGDLTTNHTGSSHEWFRTAQADADSAEAGFYFFSDHPHEYWRWSDVASLPTLDHRHPELRRRLWDGPDSVVARWTRGPDALDGWRIDVAHMTGRRGAVDRNLEVARGVRRTLLEADPDAYLVAEHFYDASEVLGRGGWHGTMDYPGFTRPVWAWLRDPDPPRDPDTGRALSFVGMPVGVPRWSGRRAAATMRAFRARIPWAAARANLTLLDSHDTSRFATVAGDHDRHVAGLGLLLTSPGAPCIFAGDEVGLRGAEADGARWPMPWDRDRWDHRLHDAYRRLIRLRRDHAALQRGGLRWAVIADDCLAYLRETPDERLLVAVFRTAAGPHRIPWAALGARHGQPLLDHPALASGGGRAVLAAPGAAVRVWRLDA